jgi:hypothetical protein
MASELSITGLVVPDPISIIPGSISGLIIWSFFGSMFSTDNTNIAPSGNAFANVGTGPEVIADNYIRCWYNAAIRSSDERYTDYSDGPITIVAVGRTTGKEASNQPLCGDSKIFLAAKEVDNDHGGIPTIASIRSTVSGPYLQVSTTTSWRAYALTEPAGGVAGTSYVMDLTGNDEATTVQTGVSSAAGAGNYLTFGTTPAAFTGSRRMDVAFVAVVMGTQMSKADIITDILTPARATLAMRGITGV